MIVPGTWMLPIVHTAARVHSSVFPARFLRSAGVGERVAWGKVEVRFGSARALAGSSRLPFLSLDQDKEGRPIPVLSGEKGYRFTTLTFTRRRLNSKTSFSRRWSDHQTGLSGAPHHHLHCGAVKAGMLIQLPMIDEPPRAKQLRLHLPGGMEFQIGFVSGGHVDGDPRQT